MENEQIRTEEASMKQLSTDIFDKICRTCMSSTEIRNIHDILYEGINLSEILHNCVAIQVKQDDYLPQNLCASCINILVQIHLFKKQCQQSDFILHTVLNNKQDKASENCLTQDIIKEANYISSHSNDEFQVYEDVLKVELEVNNQIDTIEESLTKQYTSKKRRKQIKHSRHRDYECLQCHKMFSYNSLKLHMRTHTKEKPFHCQLCQMKFSLNCNLRRHMKTHTGERPYSCDVCGKGFIQATTMVEHKRIHTGETPFKCNYCGMNFVRASQQKFHIRKHMIENGDINEPAYKNLMNSLKCSICDKLLISKGALKTHMLIHGEKKFLCSNCGKGFVSSAGLNSHMKVHTGLKPYLCNVCNKSFSQVGSLKAHILIHTGQKPYHCQVCSKTFTQPNHLKYHMRIHSGEKPYICPYCSKAFALNGTLTVHMRIHTGETPYVCDICHKGFYDSSSRKKHIKTHESNNINSLVE